MISWTGILKEEQRPVSAGGFPQVVVWNTTSKCNLNCRHCYFDAKQAADPDELNTEEAKYFIDDLTRLNTEVLLFSGGEPLLRNDIFELSGYAENKGIKAVLSTNGVLITKELAGRIASGGFSYVGISLDGLEDTHDLFRRKKGAFQGSLSGIRNCKDAGLKVGLRFTLTNYNLKDLSGIFKLAQEERIARLCIYHLVYSGRAGNLRKKDLSRKERIYALELIWQKAREFVQGGLNTEILTVDNHCDGAWICLKLRKSDPQAALKAFESLKTQKGNSSGLRIAAMDDCGNVSADQFLKNHPLGNIRLISFSNIWLDKDNVFLNTLRNRKQFLKGRCLRCSFLEICNGNFRARSEAATGDLWQEDPACYLSDEEISEKWN